jgi:hypothetical protein
MECQQCRECLQHSIRDYGASSLTTRRCSAVILTTSLVRAGSPLTGTGLRGSTCSAVTFPEQQTIAVEQNLHRMMLQFQHQRCCRYHIGVLETWMRHEYCWLDRCYLRNGLHASTPTVEGVLTCLW